MHMTSYYKVFIRCKLGHSAEIEKHFRDFLTRLKVTGNGKRAEVIDQEVEKEMGHNVLVQINAGSP